jgi:hypothetical protein
MSRRKQTVYFIKPIGMDGPIKIGCSISPDNRKRTLETWSPFPLEIVATIEGDFRIERQFHGRHLASHKSHEWFETTDLLLADIAAINAGLFDLACLPKPHKLGNTGKPRKGHKWTEAQKRNVRLHNAIRRASKASGLVNPYPFNDPRIKDFIEDPHTHGITHAEYGRRCAERVREYDLRRAQERYELATRDRAA